MGAEKVVLDTNILISALGWEGKPAEIFNKVLNKEVMLVISNHQLQELERVMGYPKFKFTKEEMVTFLDVIRKIAILVDVPGDLHVIKEDHEDDFILESAIVGKADVIISGDDHLLKLKEYGKVKIMTAADFLGL